MKNLKKVSDFQNQQLDTAKLKKVAGGKMHAGSEIDYGTHLGGGEFANDTTYDA